MEGNLIQTTLFWRVGEVKPEGELFSAPWSFTTPAKDASKLLPAPHLEAPANQATVPASNVTLNWQNVSGALYYRVALYAPDGTQVTAAIIPAPATTFTMHNLSAGTTYSWRVKAFNASGWSIYSALWHFKAA
ncbi:MAG TPA: fibronectin type III domain-containing protein [Roseiflexaceae bacterium]|nr:fibronectin type III domain-containing protein [Roseiflexaceae bacterium]